jgi:hypothetical protein
VYWWTPTNARERQQAAAMAAISDERFRREQRMTPHSNQNGGNGIIPLDLGLRILPPPIPCLVFDPSPRG